QMHRAFAARYAARKTRAPAGGYVMPFAIGLWRPDGDGRQRMIIGRYGGFTFLSPDLPLEGVLNYPGGFGMAGLLPEGVDFGSGHQEQVAVERWRLFQ